jgi:hypothetical protein
MKNKFPLSSAGKITVACLLIATSGIVIQILSGVPYPRIPPVFFMLLIPVTLIVFGRWRWTPIVAILVGLFLIIGLFTSGASVRLYDWALLGGSIGLWIQMLGVIGFILSGAIATVQNYTPGLNS